MAESGRLTTHVLDTSLGKPAAGLRIELWSLNGTRTRLKDAVTNSDGRCDEPLLKGDALKPGIYELLFHAGDYLRKSGTALPAIAFLEVVPIRFGVSDGSQHYHVPLLLSPYGYSTYRGS